MTAVSRNPFRTPQLTPQHTSTSVSNTSEFSATITSTDTGTSTQATSIGAGDSSSILEAITEDAPPAYTPMADPYQGEAAVEFGPHRPFQPAPAATAVMNTIPHITVNPTTGSPAAPSWPVPMPIPAPQAEQRRPIRDEHNFAPPPRHPSTVSLNSRVYRNSIDYVPETAPQPSPQPQTQTYLPPRAPPLQTASSARSYSPPPGPPPRRTASSSVRRPSGPSSGSGTSTAPDDGRPTTIPTPGHPLLKEGKLLVYPPGHECSKCHNTGYKNYDPSHACHKCWDKYARQYSGALAYAPFPSASAPSSPGPASQGGNNFQRPLPTFHPPQAQPASPNRLRSQRSPRPHSTAGYPGEVHHSHSQQRLPQQPPPQQPHYPPRPQQLPHFSSPQQHYQPYFPPPASYPPVAMVQHPPVGSVAYQPGDPRIGGRLCWRCDGRGGMSILFFDWETCGVCGGVGRVFN
ncbi:hypothetical protein K439DRAFT_1660834 [Ramaria rubella]|nr:hypothetical protein K439DRAFT_1660834 [Ramaria rubella]